MRVSLAIETDSHGGAETMLLELARELQARGHEVVALGPTGGEGWLTARFVEMGIERDLVEFSGFFGLGSVRQIASRLRARRVDVLHSHDFAMAVCGALGARLAGCRHVITMHGGTYYAGKLRRRVALRVAAAMSRHTVAVSQAFKKTLCASLGMRARSVDVVHNGIAAVSGSGAQVRAELGLKTDGVLVLAVGNLHEVKGHAVLLEALQKLEPSDGGVVVAIAGTGPEEGALRARAAALGVEAEVRFLGYRSDIPDLLAGADVFAMPSFSEGLPMALIEAMLAGKAIVASDVGGIPELLPSGDFGLLVPPRDAAGLTAALDELARDSSLRGRLGTAACARARQHFIASAMAERYLALYAE